MERCDRGTDRHFQLLCERVIKEPQLASDKRFITNMARVKHRGTLGALLEEIFRTKLRSPASKLSTFDFSTFDFLKILRARA